MLKKMGCYVLISALIITFSGSNAVEEIKYPWIPLCCSEFDVFNGTQCIERDEDITVDSLPVSYENKDGETVPVRHWPVNCSRYIDIPTKYEYSPINELVVNDGFVSLNLLHNYSSSFLYSFSDFCLLKYPSKYLIRLCTESNKNSTTKPEKPQQNYLDCMNTVCVSKCCPPTHHVSFRPKFGCYPTKTSFSTEFHPNFTHANGSEVSVSKNVSFIVSFPLCKLYDSKNIYLLPNGTVHLPTTKEHIHRDKYCIDYFRKGETFSLRGSICSENLEATIPEKINEVIQPVGLLISCIFLAVTFICHVIIPKLRDLQGLCFMSYVAVLFVAFLLLCLNYLMPSRFSNYGLCGVLAVLNHFFLMSSFFWLNVMCFDIWKIIRGTVQAIQLGNIHSNVKRTFIIYSIYAWGTPLVVSLATLTIHLLPDESVPDYVIRPQFKKMKCWFSTDIKASFAYYQGIIAVLFFINITFIIHTSILLYRAGVAFACCRTRTAIGESDNLKGNNRLLLNMFWHRFCLFALMAICWSTEVLAFIPPEEMWILTDTLNSLQGLFIFILFIRSANKRLMLVEAWHRAISTARKLGGRGKKDVKVLFQKDAEKGAKTKFIDSNE